MTVRATLRRAAKAASVASVLLLSLLLSSRADAQVLRDIALDQLEPTAAGDALFAVPDSTVAPGLRPNFRLLGVYARNPLVIVRNNDERSELGKIVTHQFVVHALGSIDLLGTAKVDIDVPMTLSQNGESLSWDNTLVTFPQSSALNDIRAGLRLALVDQGEWRPAIAMSGNVWFPTGDETAYTGADGIRYAVSLHAGADDKTFLWRAAVGRRRKHEAESLEGVAGSDVFVAAGAAARLALLQLGLEIFGSTVAGNGVDPFERVSTNLELMLSAKARVSDFAFGAGLGPGLTRGIGTPSFRALAMVAYSPSIDWPALAKSSERQSELAPKPAVSQSTTGDASPSDSSDSSLRLDRDGDGVPDTRDACPTIVGVVDAKPPGCPPDADEDGIADMDDKCPSESGVPSQDPERYGCPPDGDGDGIVDPDDACPRERGRATSDPKTHGCPEAVRVEGKQIVILQKVQFATGKDEIAAESAGLLSQVAQVFADHPEIARVAVDGHTDNVGSEQNNLSLARRRALAVVRYLIEQGVDERRLEARGFGPRQPIASNDTEEGRAKNRRVEFQILKRSARGESGWQDGKVDE